MNGLLHFFQGIGIHLGAAADGANLVAHIVALPVNLVDGVAGDAVLLLILHPHLGDDFHFVFQVVAQHDVKLHGQNADSGDNQQNGVAQHIQPVAAGTPLLPHPVANDDFNGHHHTGKRQQMALPQVKILPSLQVATVYRIID